MVENKKTDFFAVGKSKFEKDQQPSVAEDSDKQWKDIRPQAQVDALARNQFRKKKQDEFQAMVDEKRKLKEGVMRPVNQPYKRFKPMPSKPSAYKQKQMAAKKVEQTRLKMTPEEEEKIRTQKFQQQIRDALGEDLFMVFFETFKKYKNETHPRLDTFIEDMFELFFGHRTLAVCHHEISDYMSKKQIIIRLGDNIQGRHQDRYKELTVLHFQACENAPRSTNPIEQKQKKEAQKENKNSQSQSQPTGFENGCMICFKAEGEKLYVSKCKHQACWECWKQWLTQTLECPTCRNRVRLNQIFPVE